MTTSHVENESHHPSFMQYVVVAVILFVVTIVEFLLIWDRVGIDDDLGASKIPILIILSLFKFAVVIMFYMHLKFDASLFSLLFVSGLALGLIVGLALLAVSFGYEGKPRDYALANAVPYVHEGEAAEEHVAGEEGEEPHSGGPVNLSVGVVGDALQFDTASMEASAGSEITLTFNNISAVNQHNLVVVQAGTKDEVATAGIAAGADNNWVSPGDERVLFNSKVLDPGETVVLEFTLAAGEYTFVCTFPGHNITMFGDFTVAQ